jgi:hypothetical protein
MNGAEAVEMLGKAGGLPVDALGQCRFPVHAADGVPPTMTTMTAVRPNSRSLA